MKDAFNQDTILQDVVRDINQVFSPEICIETGTYLGQTTGFLASIFPHVVTTEIVPRYITQAKEANKSFENITYLQGDSPKQLTKFLPNYHGKKIFFFLDSHWYDRVPLLPELAAIADAKCTKPIILIHDFYVPGKSDPNDPKGKFGYDKYHDQLYTLEWVTANLDAIYGAGEWKHHYAFDVTGAERGWVLITDKNENTI